MNVLKKVIVLVFIYSSTEMVQINQFNSKIGVTQEKNSSYNIKVVYK